MGRLLRQSRQPAVQGPVARSPSDRVIRARGEPRGRVDDRPWRPSNCELESELIEEMEGNASSRVRPRRSRYPAGTLVRIRSAGEIAATLDAEGRLDGLPFMPEMAAHCGQSFVVR